MCISTNIVSIQCTATSDECLCTIVFKLTALFLISFKGT